MPILLGTRINVCKNKIMVNENSDHGTTNIKEKMCCWKDESKYEERGEEKLIQERWKPHF
jgi:hypothetical protein